MHFWSVFKDTEKTSHFVLSFFTKNWEILKSHRRDYQGPFRKYEISANDSDIKKLWEPLQLGFPRRCQMQRLEYFFKYIFLGL